MTSRTLFLTLALIGAAPMMAVAQQPAESGPLTQTAPAVASPTGTVTAAPRSGPRVVTAPARVEPTAFSFNSAEPLVQGRNQTFTISTLALVLGVVIIVLLIT